MFGLLKESSQEKYQRQANFHSSSQNLLNVFDEFVTVQERPTLRKPYKVPDRRYKEQSKSSKGEADPKRRLLQFDVQEFCDNFEKGMMKALKDISKNQKKSTSTRAPVAEPSLLISKKSKGKSETHVEELKDFSDSLPTFDEYDEEPIESLMTCENKCDLPSLEPEFVTDIEQAIVELTILQPEHPSSLVLSPQEDKPGLVFDEGATNITSIAMESHLCFDLDTTHAPLSFELQEHCEQSDFLNSQPDMFVNISSLDVIRFGLEKVLEYHIEFSETFGCIWSSKEPKTDPERPIRATTPGRSRSQERLGQSDTPRSLAFLLRDDNTMEPERPLRATH
uniref:Uncharacterized protein n=1 Tax=Brassica oleracea var. oleracea TaxID=109376 RepID=A0A0D3D3Q9_BRAOL